MKNNEWVDESYVRELFDEYAEEYGQKIRNTISNYEYAQEKSKIDMSSLISSTNEMLSFDKQLTNHCNNDTGVGTIMIGYGLFREKSIFFEAKKIEGRWMFRKI